MSVSPDGTVLVTGTINANGYTNGNNDIFLMSLSPTGTTNFVEYMGASISETPGAVVWNNSAQTYTVLINTNSLAFKD